MRNGSSSNDCRGSTGGTQHAFGQIVRTAERIDEFEFRNTQRHRVDGEIAAGKIAFQRVAVIDFRLARVGVVRVGTVGGHLHFHLGAVLTPAHRAERAEFAAHIPEAIMPKTAQNMLKLLGTRRCAEIQIMRFAMQQQAADRTPDQCQFVAFRSKHTS